MSFFFANIIATYSSRGVRRIFQREIRKVGRRGFCPLQIIVLIIIQYPCDFHVTKVPRARSRYASLPSEWQPARRKVCLDGG